MKRLLYILLLNIVVFSNCYAANIRDLFKSEPGIFLSILPENSRLDMLDYYDSGRIIASENDFNGKSTLKKVTDNFIALELTESVDIEMIMIPISKKDTIIVVNSIFKIPTADSKLQFFNTEWDEFEPKKFIKEPTMEDFISATDKKAINSVKETIDFPIISFSIDPETASITANQNLDKHLSKEEYAKISKHLLSSLKYDFVNKKYKRAK